MKLIRYLFESGGIQDCSNGTLISDSAGDLLFIWPEGITQVGRNEHIIECFFLDYGLLQQLTNKFDAQVRG